MSYIKADEIKDKFINRDKTKLYDYLTEADAELERLAEMRGIRSTDSIDTDDDGYITDHTVKRYLAYYVQYRYCEDHFGASGSGDPVDDYYGEKMRIYSKMLDEYRSKVTGEMITGDVNETGDVTINSGYIFRG